SGARCSARMQSAGLVALCPKCTWPAGHAPADTVPGPAESPPDRVAATTRSLAADSESPARFDFLAPPAADGELGRLGAFRVLGVLGRGGMGVVFRAEDTRLRRLVALKVMLPELAAGPNAKRRFLREARAAARVEHDHVVPIFQVDEGRGT